MKKKRKSINNHIDHALSALNALSANSKIEKKRSELRIARAHINIALRKINLKENAI